MTLALEEKYDQVRQLIAMGKERGYLLYDEVNDILPAEVHSSEEIDDLLSTFERYGIDVYEDLSSAKAALAAADSAESAEVKEESPAEESDLGPARLHRQLQLDRLRQLGGPRSGGQHQGAAIGASRIIQRRRRRQHSLPATHRTLIRFIGPPAHGRFPRAAIDSLIQSIC